MEPEPEAAAAAGALASEAAAPEHHPSQLDVFKNRIRLLRNRTGNFDAWVSLISVAEGTSADDIEVISLVYGSFLLEFPLCYGYWIKYAAHKARLCMNRDVVDVYEQAVQAVPHSVDLWVSYCGFGVCAYEEPADIRSLFERALSLVEKDYLCYHLWDKYIEFESSQKQLIQLAIIYINTLKFPTKKLHMYYESFRKLVTLLEQEVTSCAAGRLSDKIHTSEMIEAEDSELDISTIIADLFDQKGGHFSPEALKNYLAAGERLYKRSSKIDKEICCFEASVKRPFFHVKPLDIDQLENWHQYLDYVEKNGDFDWAVKLYERCLIPCANYSEFWIRYSEYVDAKGGREIANHALVRASSCFVKGVPTFCMYYALFKEQIGDASAARSLFVKASSNFTSGFYANINRLANMEKRMGNSKAASKIYETAIEDAMQKQNIELLQDLYSNFAQFIYAASHSIVEAKEVFVKGINRVPCKPLIKGLIQFMSTHGGPTEIPLLDSVISNAVTPGSDVSTALSPEDREDISLLFLEFVDLYGGVEELRKAWARHSKLFPHSTGNMSQHYPTIGNSIQENNKRRKTEHSIVAHDHSLEDIRKLKQTTKTDNFSLIFDKEVESQVERDIVDSGKGHRDAGEQKALENLDSHEETSRASQECTHSLDKYGMQNQMNSFAKEETDQDLSLHEQNAEKTSHEAQSHEAPVAESGDCNSPSKAIASSESINSQDKVAVVSARIHREMVCSKSDLPSGSSMPKEGGSSSDPARISPELEERHHVEVQVKLDTEDGLSVSNANLERSNDSPNTTDCDKVNSALVHESQNHVQSSPAEQLAVCAKPSSSELVNTKADTLGFQAQLQNQVANSQTHQSNNLSLPVQNIQQQGPSYTMAQNVQTSAQTQDQLFAQSNQGNQQYLQMTQGYASQMWQYYQQQLYYLQAQHNQQMQSLQQQHLPTEHLQQNFMQQVQQLQQQMVLWQQQVQQQQQQVVLQQTIPAQQLPDRKQGQHPSSSGDTKHDQNKQQQQAPQMDQQSQQLQQQQLLYFQQQQQQQMYLMQQQQQVYQQQQAQQQQQQLFQQQLMQQQQFVLQMPQLQQDSVQQQQQQQLFQQQQQQMMLLQQQFMQQQMQQYLQQQQNQQGPKDQTYNSNPQVLTLYQILMKHDRMEGPSKWSMGNSLKHHRVMVPNCGVVNNLSYPTRQLHSHAQIAESFRITCLLIKRQ
ncbi:uncharacterized protein [Setaria viridis]|uniref:Suppressor of forked domain-containing protein n=2 Tax=Setaria viridis TaxID=4556 RepID=A0A4U6U387_SETVI|nr:uncharacterized protein LOC117859574 isoform X1 [Setaria viridis]TKW10011.1 hypothetical protein SEVIR_6G101500v2 [Setaria viridis]